MDPRAVAVVGRIIAARAPAVARVVWGIAKQDALIGAWALVLGAVIVARAGTNVYVTLGGLLVAVTPAYAAAFWLIHQVQAMRDELEAATRRSHDAARSSWSANRRATEAHETALAVVAELEDDAPPTGRHAA